jgi:hypothetical protein
MREPSVKELSDFHNEISDIDSVDLAIEQLKNALVYVPSDRFGRLNANNALAYIIGYVQGARGE